MSVELKTEGGGRPRPGTPPESNTPSVVVSSFKKLRNNLAYNWLTTLIAILKADDTKNLQIFVSFLEDIGLLQSDFLYDDKKYGLDYPYKVLSIEDSWKVMQAAALKVIRSMINDALPAAYGSLHKSQSSNMQSLSGLNAICKCLSVGLNMTLHYSEYQNELDSTKRQRSGFQILINRCLQYGHKARFQELENVKKEGKKSKSSDAHGPWTLMEEVIRVMTNVRCNGQKKWNHLSQMCLKEMHWALVPITLKPYTQE